MAQLSKKNLVTVLYGVYGYNRVGSKAIDQVMVRDIVSLLAMPAFLQYVVFTS